MTVYYILIISFVISIVFLRVTLDKNKVIIRDRPTSYSLAPKLLLIALGSADLHHV